MQMKKILNEWRQFVNEENKADLKTAIVTFLPDLDISTLQGKTDVEISDYLRNNDLIDGLKKIAKQKTLDSHPDRCNIRFQELRPLQMIINDLE